MSKQSDAKTSQGYTTELKNCGNCGNRTSDMVLAAWMVEANVREIERGGQPGYDNRHLAEKNLRCGVGGFAVKKTATCSSWKEKTTA